jgi:hypothetical protein
LTDGTQVVGNPKVIAGNGPPRPIIGDFPNATTIAPFEPG